MRVSVFFSKKKSIYYLIKNFKLEKIQKSNKKRNFNKNILMTLKVAIKKSKKVILHLVKNIH